MGAANPININSPFAGMRAQDDATTLPPNAALQAWDVVCDDGHIRLRPCHTPLQTPPVSLLATEGPTAVGFLSPVNATDSYLVLQSGASPNRVVNIFKSGVISTSVIGGVGTESDFAHPNGGGTVNHSFIPAQKKLFLLNSGTDPETNRPDYVSFVDGDPDPADLKPVTPAAPIIENIGTDSAGSLSDNYSYRLVWVDPDTGVTSLHQQTDGDANGASSDLYRLTWNHPESTDVGFAIPGSGTTVFAGDSITGSDAAAYFNLYRRNDSSNESDYHLIPSDATGLTCYAFGKSTIESWSRSGTSLTFTILAATRPHNLNVSDRITVWGLTDDTRNGTYVVSAVTASQVQVTVADAGTTSGTTGYIGQNWQVDDDVANADVSTDGQLVLDTLRSLPPKCRYGFWDREFFWQMNDITSGEEFPGRIYWSTGNRNFGLASSGNPHWYYTARYFKDLAEVEGEALQGGLAVNNTRYIFSNNNIWTITGTNSNDFAFEKLAAGVGAVSPRAFWLAQDGGIYVVHTTGLYVIRGREVQPIPGPFDWATSASGASATAVAERVRSQHIVILTKVSSTHSPRGSSVTCLVAYHWPTGRWTIWDVPSDDIAVLPRRTTSDLIAVINNLHHTTGTISTDHIVKFTVDDRDTVVLTGNSTTGPLGPRNVRWTSGDYTVDTAGLNKMIHDVWIAADFTDIGTDNGDNYDDGTLYLGASVDGGSTFRERQIVSTDLRDGAIKKSVGGLSHRFRWQLRCTAELAGPFHIYGVGATIEGAQQEAKNQGDNNEYIPPNLTS